MTGSLAPSLRLQSTIVHALIMQDMNRRYAQSRLGSLMAVVEPLILIGGIYILRAYIQGATRVGSVSLALFLVTGFLTYFCFRFVVSAVAASGQRRTAALMFPQVTALDAMIAQSISSCVIYAAVLVLAFGLLVVWTGIRPNDYLYIFIAGFLTLAQAVAVGLVLGCILRVFPGLQLFVGLLMRIDLLFSGAMFLAAELPRSILPYVDWNPTFHTIEMMREAWFPGYVSPLADPAYVVELIIVLLAIGLSFERITSARIPG